jgi:hypothetical protein
MVAMLVAFAAPALADDHRWNDNDWRWNDNRWNDRFDFDDGFSQSTEQEADSGEVDQSFDVSGAGDNSNQTEGTQGVANTGNAQNQIGITQTGSDVDNNNWWDNNNHNNNWWDNNNHNNNWWDNNWWNNHNGNGFSDFDFEDSGASIEVSPINTTSSDQEVNQAASAFGR